MNIKILIGIILILAIIVIGSFIFLSPKSTTTPVDTSTIPQYSPGTSTSQISTTNLAVLRVVPENNSQDVSPAIQPNITFNQDFSIDQMVIKFNPSVSFSLEKIGNTLLIKPSQSLNLSTTYSLSLNIKNTTQSLIINFTTANKAETGSVAPDQEAVLKAEEQMRQNHPDGYLANKLPISTAEFDASSDVRGSTNSLYFIVKAKVDPTTTKNAFISYLKSIQLTDAQIQTLDIEYQ